MDEPEIHERPFYYVTALSDWNVIPEWENSRYETDVKLIQHPVRGTADDEIIGNSYTRIETTIRFTVKITSGELVRINVFKNLSHTDPRTIGWDHYLWRDAVGYGDTTIFHAGAFRSTLRKNVHLINFEPLYEKFLCKNDSEYYMSEFTYKHVDELNINSAFNQLVITVNGYREDYENTTSKFKCFAVTRFIP